ncbi:MAG: magnesium transporter, partial [Thermodesulfobacteriota bacterium]
MERTELTTLNELLERKDKKAIGAFLKDLHPADIAEFITFIEEPDKLELFLLLPLEVASKVIMETDENTRENIIGSLSKRKLTEIVHEMDTDDATDIIGDLPEEEANTVLKGIAKEESQEVQRLLQYEEDTAGGIMQAELAA